LTVEEARVLREYPERIGELYEALFPSDAFDPESNVAAAAIAKFEGDKLAELALAFEDLVLGLPFDLRNWSQHFDSRLPEDQVRHLLSKPAMARAGKHAGAAARFGLTPEVFAETFGGFALHFRLLEDEVDYEPSEADEEVSFILRTSREIDIPVAFEDLVVHTRETPGLPEVEGLAEAMTRWTLRAVEVLPLLIPGYHVTVQENSRPFVRRAPDRGMPLAARWTYRASDFGAYTGTA
jgi:hypothetical protein